MSNHRFCRAGLGDVSLVAKLMDLYRIFYGRPSDIDAAMKFVGDRLAADEAIVFLALEGYGPRATGIGFTLLYPSWTSVWMQRSWILNDLYVHESARGRGIGRSLVTMATEMARKDGAKRLTLSTAIDNAPAKALYESMGWKKVAAFDHYSLELT